ncbi:MAG: membrane protein insertion efficiency factor YidD [Mariprofundaceae bacterium]
MASKWVAGAAVVAAGRLYLLLAISSLLLALCLQMSTLPAHKPAMFPIHFFQQVVGQLDGRQCPAYPVCSVYARQALHQHGWFVGGWLIIDRLIHEADDLGVGPWVTFEGERRLYDPLKRNDFWLNKESVHEH